MVSGTRPSRRGNNPDNAIGQRIQIDEACVIYGGGGDGPAEGLVPNNGEYRFDGIAGNCNYCIGCMPRKMDSSAGCEGFFTNCASSGGGYPQYKRVSYNAPQDQCCKNGGGKTIGNLTCDPKYAGGPNTAECDGVYTNVCTGATIMSGDSKCSTWCARNKGVCDNIIRNFCVGDKLNSQSCRDKLLELGGVDKEVNYWCANHRGEEFCACYDALIDSESIKDPDAKRVLARPECSVTTCSSGGGYKYTNMRQGTPCPNVNYCKNILNVIDNKSASLNDIKQTCNQSIQTGTAGSDSAVKSAQVPDSYTLKQRLISNYSYKKDIYAPRIKAALGPKFSFLFEKFDSLNIEIQLITIFLFLICIILGIGYSQGLFDETNKYDT